MSRRFLNYFTFGLLLLSVSDTTLKAQTVISNKTLQVSDDATLGAPTASVELDNGTLLFANFPLKQITTNVPQSLVIDATGGTIATRYGSTTLTGLISGAGQLTFQYDQSWSSFTQSSYTISGTNTYSGGTIIGVVDVNFADTSASLGTGEVKLQTGGVLGVNAESNFAAGQKVGVQGGVVVLNNAAINPAHIIDSNASNTTGGILALGVDYGSALNMSAIGNGQLFLGSSGSVNYTATTLGAGAGGVYRLGGGVGTSGSQLTFTGTNNLLTGARSVLVGNPYLAQPGDGNPYSNVVLGNSNNYTGGTTLISGTLIVGNDNALGSGPLTITATNYLGGLASTGGAHTIPNAIVFNNPVGGVFGFSGTNDLTLTGTVDLGATSHVFLGGYSSHTTFTNMISNGSLTFDSGTWILAGANTFSGGLTINSSTTLGFSNDQNLGGAGVALTLAGGILQPAISLTINRPIIITSYGGTFDTHGQTLNITGIVSSSGTMTKTGAGTLIFNNSGNTLSTATIAQGALWLENTGVGASVQTTVQSGGTLGGNGYAGSTTVNSGGIFAPGTDTPGKFTINSRLTLNPGSILDFDLSPTIFDEILLTGNGSLSKGTVGSGPVLVNVFDDGGLAAGQTYTLIDWTAGRPSTITSADFQLASGPVGGSFSIVGNTLQLTTTSVPEPSSAALLIGGACFLFFGRNRRCDDGRKPSQTC